ncbi:hypothetical protein BDY19DRAFT_1052041 [Irpex rosettiformis]|uniref:Uncharacterized protein n=1 Tax=Irpex rosettiformis TaxID=378272 RepID=A0ACB8UIN4_9APHY|nr:hypothetical protein BDY19DRAFT_1052041 [Irpex rosettiformis]
MFTPRHTIAALLLPALVHAADPCAAIAGQPAFVPPAKAPHVSGPLPSMRFSSFCLNSSSPFQEPTTDIRADINATTYPCATLPPNSTTDTPVSPSLPSRPPLSSNTPHALAGYFPIFPSPPPLSPSPSFSHPPPKTTPNPSSSPQTHLIGPAFPSFFSPTGPSPFNFTRLAGSRVLSINGLDPYAYADVIAETESGSFLDYGVQPPATPPFDLGNVAIALPYFHADHVDNNTVSNGNCALTCVMFSTLAFECHQTKIAIFGGKPGEQV